MSQTYKIRLIIQTTKANIPLKEERWLFKIFCKYRNSVQFSYDTSVERQSFFSYFLLIYATCKKAIQMHNRSGITTEQESNKTMQCFKNAAISSKQQAARMTKNTGTSEAQTQLVWCLMSVQQAWE